MLTLPRVAMWLTLASVVALLPACTSAPGDTPDQKRQAILAESRNTLDLVLADKGLERARIDEAYGYATFSNIATSVLLVGAGEGYGVAVNNQDDQRTFMKSTEIEGGPGVGIAKYRTLLLFETQDAFDNFVRGNWLMAAETAAAAKTKDGGGAAEDTASFDQDVEIYQVGEKGLQAKADLSGIRFEPDEELNARR